MDTRRNNIVVTLFAVLALVFTGCQEVENLATGAAPSDIQIDTVTYSIDNATLNNKSTVTFQIDVKNLGGLDSAGAYISAYVENELIGQIHTGVMGSAATPAIPAQKTLTISWDAVAGEHSAAFLVKTATSTVADAKHRIALAVATEKLKVEEQVEVTVEVVEEEIAEVVTSVEEDVTIAEVVANVDSILADTTVTKKEDNEVAVLQTLKVVADADLEIAEEAKPIQVTLASEEAVAGDTAEPKVEATFIPLAKQVVQVDEITGDTLKDEITGEVVTKAEVDTGSFLIAIKTEVEEVTAQEVTDTGVVVTATEKKEVTVPVAVKRDEEAGTVKLENGFGGIEIDASGNISLLSLAATRSVKDEFWIVMKDQLASAAVTYATSILNGTPFVEALITFMVEFTSIVQAYELMTAVTNEKPEITVEASVETSEVREGNDKVVTSWKVFTATATDDKDGVTFLGSNVFNPGIAGYPGPASGEFTAEDSDGETTSVTVTSTYTRQVIVNFYVHDQGAVN